MRQTLLNGLSFHQHQRLCGDLHFVLSLATGKANDFSFPPHIQTLCFQDIFASSGFMFIAGVTQCFMFCNSAQIVKSAANDCSRAIYNSFWYQLRRIDQRKIFLFMMMQSQKDVGFTAGGFTISLELFMIVSLPIYSPLKVKKAQNAPLYVLNGFIKNYFYLNVVFVYNCKIFSCFPFLMCIQVFKFFFSLKTRRKPFNKFFRFTIRSYAKKKSLTKERKWMFFAWREQKFDFWN